MIGMIVDTETTGSKPGVDKVIEFGYVIHDFDLNEMLACGSSLFYSQDNDAFKHNNIKPSILLSQRNDLNPFILSLIEDVFNAYDIDFVMAHNAAFDKNMLHHHGIEFPVPWICSYRDFRWPCGQKKLTEIAVSLGVPIVKAHRALTDCLLLSDCLMKLDDLQERIEYSFKPKNKYMAYVTYANKDLAKQAGFSWDPSKSQWVGFFTEEEVFSFPFQVALV